MIPNAPENSDRNALAVRAVLRGGLGFAIRFFLILVAGAAETFGGAQSPLVPPRLEFTIRDDVPHRELSRQFCWFHPRVAAIPGLGRAGKPVVIMTLQKHLVADDFYSGLWFMRTDDGGGTWTGPTEIPELAWQVDPDGTTVSVADVTPGWHAPTGRLLAIGTKVRYNPRGAQLLDQPRSHECAYATFDPKTGNWSRWKFLALPEISAKFFLVAPGCVQWLVRPDGSVLIPVYFKGPTGSDYSVTVLLCAFDGETLRYVRHGDELTFTGGRGFVEPSLVLFRGKYFLTLRNDARGFVTTSDDGLHFAPPRPWTFDDGQELGSYNTQQHWLAHSDGLFLSYTRRGANNDHIARNRAPLFLAQVDHEKLRVLRATEKVLIPERGVMLGNFGAAPITADESWVTDAEFMTGGQAHPRGADGSVHVARVNWSRPNALVTAANRRLKVITLGDSITKGVRFGVATNETFAALLEARLRQEGFPLDVRNSGIGSERTDLALARLDRDVIQERPDVVTIMYGTNDSFVDQGRTDSRLTSATFAANLQTLVERLRAAGIQAILMTEPRWGKAASLNGVGEHPNVRLEKFVTASRELARAKNFPLVDHFEVWSKQEANGIDIGQWTTDQCHPNPTGHAVLAEALLPVVRESLLRAR